MTPRDVVTAALVQINGHDPDYDDGVDADAILAALRDAGFDVVPRKPTAAMLGKVRVNGGDTSVAYALAVWPDMLAAAKGETR